MNSEGVNQFAVPEEQVISKALDEALAIDTPDSPLERQAARILATETALEIWTKTVKAVIRQSKGLKAEEEVELPTGERGTYIRYAFDNRGQLSTGKGKGRRQRRIKPHQLEFTRLSQQLFGVYLQSEFKKATAQLKLDTDAAQASGSPAPEMPAMSQDIFNKAQLWATRKAEELIKRRDDVGRKAARKRRDTSRRINAGILAGNSDRRSHSGV